MDYKNTQRIQRKRQGRKDNHQIQKILFKQIGGFRMHYITVQAEINLEDYEQEIRDALIFDGNTKTLQEYIEELEKNLTYYQEQYRKTPQEILEDLKSL